MTMDSTEGGEGGRGEEQPRVDLAPAEASEVPRQCKAENGEAAHGQDSAPSSARDDGDAGGKGDPASVDSTEVTEAELTQSEEKVERDEEGAQRERAPQDTAQDSNEAPPFVPEEHGQLTPSLSGLGISEDREGDAAANPARAEHDIDDDDSAQRRSFGGHRRVDSVPPQRYQVSSLAQRSKGADPSSPSRFPSDSHYSAASTDTGRRELSQSGDMERSSSSETEDAGLDFVDISLGQALQSPYGAGAGVGASRSALEIRQDSIASTDSEAARRDSLDRDAGEHIDWPPGDHVEQTPKPRDVAKMHISLKHTGFSEAQARALSQGSAGPMTPRSAEGRYRGRLSQTNSGAASPVLQSPALPESLSNRSIASLTGTAPPAVSMTVVGEDGEIRTVPSSAIAIESPQQERQKKLSEVDRQSLQDGQDDEPVDHSKQRESSDVPAEGELGYVRHDMDEVAESAKTASTSKSDNEVTSPGLKDAADVVSDKSKDKKRRESAGVPSAFEQHMSRTRMMTLPPKPKQEDARHLNDFEAIMKQSREAEKRRQQDEAIRRVQRDLELQENMKTWESDILPSWMRARREGKLRKLWWKGIPPMLRGRLWALACGNNQMLPRNLFTKASEDVREGQKSGAFASSIIDAIQADIEETLPTLRLFQKDVGALHEDLFELLCAFTEYRLDQMRAKSLGAGDGKSVTSDGNDKANAYIRGTASLAAMLMINLAPSDALIALINLITEKPWLRALYSVHGPPSQAQGRTAQQQQHPAAGFERVFDTLLADQWPKVYANMQARGIRPSAYGSQWIRTLFVPYLPLETVARLWDCILLDEGDALLFRIGIAIFTLLSARLYVPDKAELVSILRGNNRASIVVWNRSRADRDVLTSPVKEHRESVFAAKLEAEKDSVDETQLRESEAANGNGVNGQRRSPPLSPSSADQPPQTPPVMRRRASSHLRTSASIEAPEEMVPRDDIYGAQYGITESMLFRTLEEQDSWWKNSTLERLLDRELVA